MTLIQNFEKECQKHLHAFIEDYTTKEGIYIPLPLLYGYISEQFLLYQERSASHPLVEPYEAMKGNTIKHWEFLLKKHQPEVLETIFGTKKKSQKLLRKLKNMDEYQYLFAEPNPENNFNILDFDIGGEFVEKKKPYLPFNIFEPPERPIKVNRGTALQIFYAVSFIKS